VNDAQLLNRPRYLTTGRKNDPIFDRKAWPRRGRCSLSTPTRFFDRKACHGGDDTRFRLRPASPTGRPIVEETMLASDSDPLFRLEGLSWRGRRMLPTPTHFSDQEYTEPLLTALLRPARSELTGNDRPGTPTQ
jgi:hypothetical protein